MNANTNLGPMSDTTLAAAVVAVVALNAPADPASVVGSSAYWEALYAQGDAHVAALRAASAGRGGRATAAKRAAA